MTANLGGNSVSILLNNGDGTFGAAQNVAAGGAAVGVTASDFNHDGNLDLATASFSAPAATVLLGNGDGTFRGPVSYATGGILARSITLSDLNGDGAADLGVVTWGGTLDILLG